jgi:uncharacterized membrane protein
MTTPARRSPRLSLLTLRLSRRWLTVVIVALTVYVTLPLVAPTLIHLGLTGPGAVIYRLYGPFCHQFAFRSFFLYGSQPAYPRAVSGTDLVPFEPFAVASPFFLERYAYWYGAVNDGAAPGPVTEADLGTMTPWLEFASKDFYGTPEMGYKMALCQRDITLYGALLLGALVYSVPVVRRRLRPAPLWLFVFLGMGPIGIDGMSQLISYPPFSWWPPRETLPAFRVVTGALLGLMSAWLFLPRLDRSFAETTSQLTRRLRATVVTTPTEDTRP